MKHFFPTLTVTIAVGVVFLGCMAEISKVRAASKTVGRPRLEVESTGDEVIPTNLVLVEQGEWQKPEEKQITYLDLEDDERNYYLKLNHPWNTLTVYTEYYPGSGEFDQPYAVFATSVGTGDKTKLGVYQLDARDPSYELHPMIGNCWTQYDRRFDSDKLTHSETYDVPKGGIADNFDYGSMHTSAFNKIGDAASSGCIRLRVGDAAWIYYNVQDHATLEIYSDLSSPGPLGKPTVQRITDACPNPYRRWDPTDPHPDNPWQNATPEQMAEWLEDAVYKEVKGAPASATKEDESSAEVVEAREICLNLLSDDGILHLTVAPTYEQIKANFSCHYLDSGADLDGGWNNLIGGASPEEWNLYFEGDHNLEEPGIYYVTAYAMDVATEATSERIEVVISVE